MSALVYRSGAASGPRVEQALAALEESPPPRPPRRPLAGLAGRLRARLTLRRAGLPALGALVAVGLVAGAATQLSVLGAADDGRWSLWREPSSTVEQWWSCQTFDVTAVARAGVDHVALDRSATQTHRGVGPVGNDERAVTWDGESVVDYGGEDVPVPADFTRPRLPFADLDAVLDSFGVTDPVVSARRDTTGASFTRYESLPLDELERGLAPVERLGGRWETSVVWVLDVWLDDRDRPVRIRQMIDSDPGWFEWLRLDTPTRDSTPPSCDQAAGGRAGPWLGAEPWSPSLEVPLKVAFDGAGHPYDPSSATEGEEWLPIGGLNSPSGVVALTSLEALVYGAEWGDRAEVVTVPPGTALRAEIYGPGGGAHRIRVETGGGGGTGAVARWRPVAELDLLELTPVMAVAEPGFDPDQMAEIYDELGDGVGAGHRLDLDGDGVDDAMVLGGYGNDAQVYVGENAAGAVVELVSVLDDVPWRLLDLPGEPPADVLRREQELAACVAETRPTGPDGVCRRGA